MLRSFPTNEELQELLDSRIRQRRGVGIVLGLLDVDGSSRVVRAGSGGPAARELSAESVFELGSITKAFTGILLAEMSLRGEVKPDDPVRLYLPSTVRVPLVLEEGSRFWTSRPTARPSRASPATSSRSTNRIRTRDTVRSRCSTS